MSIKLQTTVHQERRTASESTSTVALPEHWRDRSARGAAACIVIQRTPEPEPGVVQGVDLSIGTSTVCRYNLRLEVAPDAPTAAPCIAPSSALLVARNTNSNLRHLLEDAAFPFRAAALAFVVGFSKPFRIVSGCPRLSDDGIWVSSNGQSHAVGTTPRPG